MSSLVGDREVELSEDIAIQGEREMQALLKTKADECHRILHLSDESGRPDWYGIICCMGMVVGVEGEGHPLASLRTC